MKSVSGEKNKEFTNSYDYDYKKKIFNKIKSSQKSIKITNKNFF